MLSITLFKIFASKYIWATTLTFQGHVMSLVTWPLDTPGVIPYICSVVEFVSPAISEVMGSKYIGVITMAYQGHVTSLVILPFVFISLGLRTSRSRDGLKAFFSNVTVSSRLDTVTPMSRSRHSSVSVSSPSRDFNVSVSYVSFT